MCTVRPLPAALHLISLVRLHPLEVSPSSREAPGLVRRLGHGSFFLRILKSPFHTSGTRIKGASESDGGTEERKIKRVKVGDQSGES